MSQIRGDAIKEKRLAKKLTQKALAKLVGVELNTVYKWEKEKITPSFESINILASVLNTSIAYLMGEDEPSNIRYPTDKSIKIVKVITFTRGTAPCCGSGNNIEYANEDIESIEYFPGILVGKHDEERPPFMVYADGDSMEQAKIYHDSRLLINPAEDVYSGDVAMIEWGLNDKVTAIKYVHFNSDGTITAKNRRGSQTFSKEEINNEFFRICGKVVFVGNKPQVDR